MNVNSPAIALHGITRTVFPQPSSTHKYSLPSSTFYFYVFRGIKKFCPLLKWIYISSYFFSFLWNFFEAEKGSRSLLCTYICSCHRLCIDNDSMLMVTKRKNDCEWAYGYTYVVIDSCKWINYANVVFYVISIFR